MGTKPRDNIFFLCIGNRKNQLSPIGVIQWGTEFTVGVGTEWWSECMEVGCVDGWGCAKGSDVGKRKKSSVNPI